MAGAPSVRVAARLIQTRLQELGSRSTVTPIKAGTKRPQMPHKGGVWTAEVALRWFNSSDFSKAALGILLWDELVLDFDNLAVYDSVLETFPELERAPAEKSKRGIHIFLKRTEALSSFTDCPLKDPATGEKLQIDAKTVTSSHHDGIPTRGVIVIAPSPGRQWLEGRSLLEIDPLEPSPELVAWIIQRRGGGDNRAAAASKRRATTTARADRPPKATKPSSPSEPARWTRSTSGAGTVGIASDGELYLRANPEVDRIDAALVGFGLRTKRGYANGEWNDARDWIGDEENLRCSYLWKDTGVKPCPICGKGNHENQYMMQYTLNGERWISNLSADCGRMRLPFSERAVAKIRELFEAQCAPVSAEDAAAVALWAAEHRLAPPSFFRGVALGLGGWLFFRDLADGPYFVVRGGVGSSPGGNADAFSSARTDTTPWWRSARPAGASSGPALPASNASFKLLVEGLLSFPLTQRCHTTVVRFPVMEVTSKGPRHRLVLEQFEARPQSGCNTCILCEKVHREGAGRPILNGKVVLTDDGTYVLVCRAGKSPNVCSRESTVDPAAARAYIERLEQENQSVDGGARAALASMCAPAGLYIPDNAAVWHLTTVSNAPGGASAVYAIDRGNGYRFTVVVVDGQQGGSRVWWRRSMLPGLVYEFFDASAWTAGPENKGEPVPLVVS